MEISPLICSTNQWNGFYMIATSTMKELHGSLAKSLQKVKMLIESRYVWQWNTHNIPLLLENSDFQKKHKTPAW